MVNWKTVLAENSVPLRAIAATFRVIVHSGTGFGLMAWSRIIRIRNEASVYRGPPRHFSNTAPTPVMKDICWDSLIFEEIALASSPLPAISNTIAR